MLVSKKFGQEPPTWRIIPFSKWLITMVIVSPLSVVIPGYSSPNGRNSWLINGGDTVDGQNPAPVDRLVQDFSHQQYDPPRYCTFPLVNMAWEVGSCCCLPCGHPCGAEFFRDTWCEQLGFPEFFL